MTEIFSAPRLAFIGLGALGARWQANLLAAGLSAQRSQPDTFAGKASLLVPVRRRAHAGSSCSRRRLASAMPQPMGPPRRPVPFGAAQRPLVGLPDPGANRDRLLDERSGRQPLAGPSALGRQGRGLSRCP